MLKIVLIAGIAAATAALSLPGSTGLETVPAAEAETVFGSQCTHAIPTVCFVPGYACTKEKGGFLLAHPGLYNAGQTSCNVDTAEGDGHKGCGHIHKKTCAGDPIPVPIDL